MSYLGAGPGKVYLPPPGQSLDYSQFNPATQAALAGYRNKLINGNFDLWQRGTSLAAAVYNGIYLADRWRITTAGTTIAPSRQSFALGQTDVPGEPAFYHRCVVASVAGASNRALLYQQVESVRSIIGQAVLSFWAKADAAKNIAVEFQRGVGTGGSPTGDLNGIGVTTIPLTASWQKFRVPVILPSLSGVVLGTDNNDSINAIFWFDAGSSFNSRTNSLGQQSGVFDIARVQWEIGSVDTPFEQRPIGLELSLCQRFYVRFPSFCFVASGVALDATHAYIMVPLPVAMRAQAAMGGVTAGCKLYSNVSAAPVSAVGAIYGGQFNTYAANVTTSSNMTPGASVMLFTEASGYVDFSAEL